MTKIPALSDEEIAEILGDVWSGLDAVSIPIRRKRIRHLLQAQRKLLEEWVNPYELSEWAQKNLCYEDLHKLIGWLEQGDAKDTS